MFLDGRVQVPGATIEVRNPFNGELVGAAAADGAAEVAQAVDRAARYRGLLPSKRAAVLARLADLLARDRAALAELNTLESGKLLKESLAEVEQSCSILRTAAEEATRLTGETIPIEQGGGRFMALTVKEPFGVIAAITPFNRPLNQVVVKVAPGFAANNAVVLKPSEKTPLSALRFAELAMEADMPPDALTVVTGRPRELGEALITHPRVAMVTFTGSVATGARIAQLAAPRKLVLELGGNDPLIVLSDADLDAAAALAAQGAFSNAGQSCRGVKRVVVMDDVADELVVRLVKLAREMRTGDPMRAETSLGTVISAEAAAEVVRRVNDAVQRGAKLCCGGNREGAVVSATVIDHVPPDAELVVEETFGPVAPVIRVKSLEEVSRVCNATDYGLQAGVVTNDHRAFVRLANALQVGAVNLMLGPHFSHPRIPFGGMKKSGIGREGVRYAMEEMSVVKTIVLPW